MTTFAVVGKPVPREDGPDKVSGNYTFPADFSLPGMLWGKVLRSPFPHARIVNIDGSAALKLPGVRAVVTGKDMQGMLVGRGLRDMPVLAWDKVRFVGERVAAVAADEPDIAEEALNLIEVEYEELPAVFDGDEAMQPGAPLVHEANSTYLTLDGSLTPQGNIVVHDHFEDGDVDQGFGQSDYIFEHTFNLTWVHQHYMEPYACVVDIDDAGRIQVWANNKQPFLLREMTAQALGIDESSIRVNPCGIGGDFGGKAGPMDVPVAYFLSQRSGRPIKILMNYIDEFRASNPRHPAKITIKTGVKKDGTFVARKSWVVFNGGAYGGFRGRLNVRGGRQAGGGPYYVPNFVIDSYMTYTNNVPCGSYRAPGDPQGMFAVESHTDMIAHELGIDPYELRLRNMVREGQVCATGEKFHHIRAEETLRAVAEATDWYGPKKGPAFGRGIAIGQRPPAGATSVSKLAIDLNGRVSFFTPTPETGVGAHTIQRQVAAEDLGITAEEIKVIRLDTDAVPFDTGAGAATSRIAGRAALGAAQDLRHKLTAFAAEIYGWPEEKIVFRGGQVFLEGGQRQVSLKELAAKAVAAQEGPVVGEGSYKADHGDVTSFCAQVADVAVDQETGQVTVYKITTAHDVGTVLNPLGHQGQIDGGVIQGLGYALMEELKNEDGRISTLTMGDVKIPTMPDIPELATVLLESPDGTGPYKGKGIGENPISPVSPAIANAVYDAVGVRISDLPITAEKVLKALREKIKK